MRITAYACRSFRRNRNLKLVCVLGISLYIGFWLFKHRSDQGISRTKSDFHQRHDFGSAAECVETKNLVYIKMIKCASTTLSGVIRRFGLERNLSFVLPPRGRIYVGWPYQIDETMYRPSKMGGYNILCDHAVYDRTIMERIMPPDAVYITSIREPFSQFKSTLNYYNVFNISGLKSSDPLGEYLSNIEKYEAVYKSHDASKTRYCIPDGFSMTRNLMSFNLGFPTGFAPGTKDMSNDEDFVQDWIGRIDGEFQLVMLTELFHESMVLLRRMMCWTLRDIVFTASNQLEYGYRNQSSTALEDRYREWSRVDYALYDHFKTKLWRRLNQESDDFWNEVQHFRKVNDAVNRFCQALDLKEGMLLKIPESKWYKRETITISFCELMQDDLLVKLQENYEQLPPDIKELPQSKPTC